MVNNDTLAFRVYSEADGRVYLFYEPQNCRVEVEKPLSEHSLEMAGNKLVELSVNKLHEGSPVESYSETNATPQQLANREIKAIVDPPQDGLLRFVFRAGDSLFELVLVVFAGAVATFPVYKLVQWSQDHLPAMLHLVVLLVCAAVLALSIYLIAAPERLSDKQFKFWFGKNGLPFLACFNLIGASSVFASVTFWLYNQNQWVNLQPCAGRPVAPGSLLDFYMWHLLKLVPLLKLNETLKWGEPLCYTQARVGVLVLLFQALVVLPCINALRFYWKNRRFAETKPYKFIYEPGWQPKGDLEP